MGTWEAEALAAAPDMEGCTDRAHDGALVDPTVRQLLVVVVIFLFSNSEFEVCDLGWEIGIGVRPHSFWDCDYCAGLGLENHIIENEWEGIGTIAPFGVVDRLVSCGGLAAPLGSAGADPACEQEPLYERRIQSVG